MIIIKNNKFYSVGIDPAGIGTTGIVIKSYGTRYPRKWHTQIEATNPVEAFILIRKWIRTTVNSYYEQNVEIKHIAVELLHGGDEKYREVKATRELIGMLRFFYKNRFCGHLPSDKKKVKDLDLKSQYKGKMNDHWIDALAILNAHLKEKELGLKVEKYNLEVINYGN